MYSLNINSGIATQLFPGGNEFIQATFPSEKTWVKASSPAGSGPLNWVDQNGKAERFFDNFLIPTDPFVRYPPIQGTNQQGKYLLKAQGPGDTNYKFWLVSKQEKPQLIFDPGMGGIDQFTVSPDRRYIGLTYNTSSGEYLYIFSLENLQLLYKWIYPYRLGSGDFIWSPDSQSIVLQYSETDVMTSARVNFGIQIMSIKTGKTKIILKQDVTQIIDWHNLP